MFDRLYVRQRCDPPAPLSACAEETDMTGMKFSGAFLVKAAGTLAVVVASSGCFGLDNLFQSPTTSTSSTSSTPVRSYLGVWTGPTLASTPAAQSCGNLQWKITSQTPTQITGDFTAVCAGTVTLAGTLVATITDSTIIPWAASGTASQGSNSCVFTLTGTGTFQGTSNILVNYAGTACGIAVAGSDTITRS
jgi:hypothetical protein